MRSIKWKSFSTSSALPINILKKTMFMSSHLQATYLSNQRSFSKQNNCYAFWMPISGSRDQIDVSPSRVLISSKTIQTEDGNSWISNISIQKMWRPGRPAIETYTLSRMLWVQGNNLPARFVLYLPNIWEQRKNPITWKRRDAKVIIALSSFTTMILRKNSRLLHQGTSGEAPNVRCFLLATLEMHRNLFHSNKAFWILTLTSIQLRWALIRPTLSPLKNVSKGMMEKAGTFSW